MVWSPKWDGPPGWTSPPGICRHAPGWKASMSSESGRYEESVIEPARLVRRTRSFERRGAVVVEQADVAAGLSRLAHRTAVQDEPETQRPPFRGRHQPPHLVLDLHRIGRGREAQPAEEPADVGVDRQPGRVEGDAAHDVARLAADAGEGDEVVERARHLPAEPLDD